MSNFVKLRCSIFFVLMLSRSVGIQYGIWMMNVVIRTSYIVNYYTPLAPLNRGMCSATYTNCYIFKFSNFQIGIFSNRTSYILLRKSYLNAVTINKAKLVITLPILTHSPVDIFLVNGFSGTTI